MELLQLKYFCKIVYCGTMTQAAKELHISQPALSSMLRKLEKELGGPLFAKDGRGIRLNERGALFFNYAQKTLVTLDELKDEIQKFNSTKQRLLTLKLKAASQLMIPIIRTFQQKYPLIQITLIQNKEDESAAKKEADLIVTASSKKHSGCITLMKEELLLAVPQKHPLSKKDSVAVNEFKDENFILLSQDKVLRQITDGYFRKMNFSPKIVLESDDINMIKELIKSGYGVSVIPEKSWANLSESGFKKLHVTSCSCVRYILLQQNKRQINEAASLFIEEIQNMFESK